MLALVFLLNIQIDNNFPWSVVLPITGYVKCGKNKPGVVNESQASVPQLFLPHTVNDRLSAAALISFSLLKVRRLSDSGAYFNYA